MVLLENAGTFGCSGAKTGLEGYYTIQLMKKRLQGIEPLEVHFDSHVSEYTVRVESGGYLSLSEFTVHVSSLRRMVGEALV